MDTATMARKRTTGTAKASKPAAAKGMTTRALRMSTEYADWMERFAAKERVSVSALIDRALASHAAREGFQLPPERK